VGPVLALALSLLVPMAFNGPTGRMPLRAGWHVGGRTVTVPYSPNAHHLSSMTAYRGSVARFTKTFTVAGGDYAIRFESVQHRARVWVDGHPVARHTGAYLPFEVRLPLRPGPHRLTVRADWRDPNRMRDEGWFRSWFNFGGLNREVTIRRLGASELDAPAVDTRLRRAASGAAAGGAAVASGAGGAADTGGAGRRAASAASGAGSGGRAAASAASGAGGGGAAASGAGAAGGGTAAADVTVTVRVRNRAARRTLRVAGTLGGARLSFPAVTLGRNEQAWVRAHTTIARPRLWAPGSPNLYDLRLAVPGEPGYQARVGLRQLTKHGDRLYLNGRRVRLKGASIQEDAPGRGDALTTSDMDAIVARLKKIGANATRAQHSLSPALMERLDRAGILVWQGVGPFDVPGRWAADTPAKRAVAARRARLDILDNRLHPSIVTWNLINEVQGNGIRHGQRTYVVNAAKTARALGGDRLVAVDVWGTHLPAHPGTIYRAVDAVGGTNYEGWYDDLWQPKRLVDARIRAWTRRLHALFPDKVLSVTEFGAEADPANPTHAPGGLDFQADLLARHIRAYRDDDHLTGMLAWSLQDFALRPNFLGGSVRAYAPALRLHRGINAKGLFTYDGRPKPAADVVRRLFDG
jgi:hypothetical protein